LDRCGPLFAGADTGRGDQVRRLHRTLAEKLKVQDSAAQCGGESLYEALVTIDRYTEEPLLSILPVEEGAAGTTRQRGAETVEGPASRGRDADPVLPPLSETRTLSYLMCAQGTPEPSGPVTSLVDDGEQIPTAPKGRD